MNPRLLLVEDDPVSQAFLAEVARGLPADVDCAASVAQALGWARAHRHDAWLIDAHLPDGSGAALLAQLRGLVASSSPPALGHTASRSPSDLQALRAAGFDAVVSKPLPADQWSAALRRLLRRSETALWDNDAALRALHGNAEAMHSLRRLFIAELPKQQPLIEAALAAGDIARARAELHRLKASCGFVGATRMREVVDELYATPMDAACVRQFHAALADTLGEPAPPD